MSKLFSGLKEISLLGLIELQDKMKEVEGNHCDDVLRMCWWQNANRMGGIDEGDI